MNEKNASDLLFEEYLTSQGLTFEYEPPIEGSTKRVDYVVNHPEHGRLYFEVKQIEVPLPKGFSQYDPYPPVRNHLRDGAKQFKGLPDTINALVFVAAPNSFVHLGDAVTMLGAMYGDFAFKVPIQIGETPKGPAPPITAEFLPGKGRMFPNGKPQNSRISAVITLHRYHLATKAAHRYLCTEDGRTREDRWKDLISDRVQLPGDVPCVIVWENGLARRQFPRSLFRGPMDARWSAESGEQVLSFLGKQRVEFGLDKF
ncbi:MAG TPA: hypothetical protein VKV02_04790 [Acidobacteriaceae bacterium]|nr:hypothetical protein [Acidobacteriaceae bacterium]